MPREREIHELEKISRRWRDVYANSAEVDPDGARDWGDLLYGFLLGAGVPPEQAAEIADLAPTNYWPV